MITIGFSTRESNPTFIEHLKKTVGPKNVEIIEGLRPENEIIKPK